ncbi:MAG: Trk family potassium uptake protein [Oscillospiraceae bacterium]|nr:Trk family potassium uptake protein [Oscillospiraceae bacterium]
MKNNRPSSKHPLNYSQTLALGFLCIILLGAVLLCLPIAAKDDQKTGFLNALFTSVSATCVTGLSVFDTATHWSAFGKTVILLLIQIGGLGFMFVVSLFSMISGKKMALHERRLLAETTGSMRLSGVVRLLRNIAAGTFIIEGCGALLFAIRFCPALGLGKGIAYAIFHSVSAFCNAGFDLTGYIAPSSSLLPYRNDPLILLTSAALIILGGLGFFVWTDLLHCKHHFTKWKLHTKLVVVTSGILLLGGWLVFFFTEAHAALAGEPLGIKLLGSFFQSVTARTAGFDAIGQGNLSEGGLLLTNCLMLIGGSPGSTAGGIKTTTIAILVLNIISTVKKRSAVEVFHRRIEEETVRQALAIIGTYICAIIVGSILLCCADPISSESAVYECISAIATVGLTTGITPTLSVFSKIVLMLMMFAGRIGGLSLLMVLSRKKQAAPLECPTERILVG